MSDKNEEQRNLKQTYLREAIIDAGYDPEKFVQYLGSEKENGTDIDNWDLEELKLAVLNYKRFYSLENDINSPKQPPLVPQVPSNESQPPLDPVNEGLPEKPLASPIFKKPDKEEVKNPIPVKKQEPNLIEEDKDSGAILVDIPDRDTKKSNVF